MAWCDTCAAKTVHVDGKCREHKVIRRKKRRAVAAPPAPRRGMSTLAGVAIVLVLVGGYFVATRVLGYGRASSVDTGDATSACDDQQAEIVRLKREIALLQSEINELEGRLHVR